MPLTAFGECNVLAHVDLEVDSAEDVFNGGLFDHMRKISPMLPGYKGQPVRW